MARSDSPDPLAVLFPGTIADELQPHKFQTFSFVSALQPSPVPNPSSTAHLR